MGAQHTSSLQLHYLAFALAEIAAQEVVVVYLAEETDTLRVLAVGRRKMGCMGYVAHLAFHHAANGEHQLGNLLAVQLRQEVGLVLDWILGRSQKGDTLQPFGGGVMSGGCPVVFMPPTLFESPELDEFVAHHVRVRGQPPSHRVNGIGHHVVPVLTVQVNLLESASITLGNELRDLDVLFGGTVNIALLVLHAYADIENIGLDALLAKQVQRLPKPMLQYSYISCIVYLPQVEIPLTLQYLPSLASVRHGQGFSSWPLTAPPPPASPKLESARYPQPAIR